MEFVAANQPCRRQHYHYRPTTTTGRLVGRIADILAEAKKTRVSITPKAAFVPHAHLELYYNDYKRTSGEEVADSLMTRNREALAKIPVVTPPTRWKATEENWNHPAMQKLHEDYTSQGKRPPVEARLRAYKAAGYPESYLLKVLKRHEEVVRKKPELDEWFDRVMGPYANKKETVPKPKTLKQIFKIKAVKPVKPDDDDVDEEEQ